MVPFNKDYGKICKEWGYFNKNNVSLRLKHTHKDNL